MNTGVLARPYFDIRPSPDWSRCSWCQKEATVAKAGLRASAPNPVALDTSRGAKSMMGYSRFDAIPCLQIRQLISIWWLGSFFRSCCIDFLNCSLPFQDVSVLFSNCTVLSISRSHSVQLTDFAGVRDIAFALSFCQSEKLHMPG